MDLLTMLPDMNSDFKGGWLLDYTSEESLQEEPIIARRWRFRSAHKIDSPLSETDKRDGLELTLRLELL